MTRRRNEFARKQRTRPLPTREPRAAITWKDIFIPKVLLGIAVLATGLTLLTVILMAVLQPPLDNPAGYLAAVTSVAPPTSTPRRLQQIPTQAVQVQPTATILPGEIGIGVYVQISGTQGTGLRVRIEPGLNTDSLFLGYDDEVFKVVDGPRQVDGYTWWKLSATYDATRSGWAAQDYLVVIQSP